MDTLPVEILLIIGTDNIESYRLMLAIPKFARAITAGIRLNMMERILVCDRFSQPRFAIYLRNPNSGKFIHNSMMHKTWKDKHSGHISMLFYGGSFILRTTKYNMDYHGNNAFHSACVLHKYSTSAGDRSRINNKGVMRADFYGKKMRQSFFALGAYTQNINSKCNTQSYKLKNYPPFRFLQFLWHNW